MLAFKENYSKYKELMPQLFFKTVNKGLRLKNFDYGVETIGERSYFYTKPRIVNIYDNTPIMLSPMYKNIFDRENRTFKKEYRAFVVDGELYSISRSFLNYHVDVPQYVVDYANKKIEEINTTNFVKNYVLDITECIVNNKQVVDIIEANPICCAGLEVSNDLLNPIKPNKLHKPTM